jgi:hypothetical protein
MISADEKPQKPVHHAEIDTASPGLATSGIGKTAQTVGET